MSESYQALTEAVRRALALADTWEKLGIGRPFAEKLRAEIKKGLEEGAALTAPQPSSLEMARLTKKEIEARDKARAKRAAVGPWTVEFEGARWTARLVTAKVGHLCQADAHTLDDSVIAPGEQYATVTRPQFGPGRWVGHQRFPEKRVLCMTCYLAQAKRVMPTRTLRREP